MEHPEMDTEQSYFDRAAEERERRRSRALDDDAGSAAIHAKAAADLREARKLYAGAMGGPDQPVAFWRMDLDDGGTYYIGKAPIFDRNYDALVISWKSDVAGRFPRASKTTRFGVRRKRVFTTELNTIVDIVDDDLLSLVLGDSPSVVRDSILRDLARRRDGRLTDIIRTLEEAQDLVMRAPSNGVLVVQGGPGTGKTVIGLQRISLLLYRDQLEPSQMLFVGPSRGFLRYVENVLPGLGDENVPQVTITDLSPLRIRKPGRELAHMARVKGDARMAELLARAMRDRRAAPDEDIVLQVAGRELRISPDEVWDLVRPLDEGNYPHNRAREVLRDQLTTLVANKLREAGSVSSRNEGIEALRGNRQFENLLDRVWPTFSPQEFLRDLLGSERRLKEHSWNLFSEAEVLSIARPQQARLSAEPWTDLDLALIDELSVLLDGPESTPSHRHIVIDEAQDLAPMQLRSIRRRMAGGITLLGDLAQATGSWAHRSWNEVTEYLGQEAVSTIELEIGYRVPSEVMAVAERIAQTLDLPVKLPRPIREAGEEPTFLLAEDEPVLRAAVRYTKGQLAHGRSVGVICADSAITETGNALDYENVGWGDGRETTQQPVTLVGASAAKGLEFDSVVVIEPSAIIEQSLQGASELFVALTRTTRALAVIYSQPLPPSLADLGKVAPDPTEEPAPQTVVMPSPLPTPSSPPDRVPSEIDGLVDDVLQLVVDRTAATVGSLLNPEQWDRFMMKLRIELDRRHS